MAKEAGSSAYWRGPDEFTYLKRAESKEGQKPARKFEVVLRSENKETVLSGAWPDALIGGPGK